jgi:imidazole glycerol-phosphate synthase subunit HisH
MTKKIILIDYGMGNLQSIQNAFQKLGEIVHVSKDPLQIKNASALILPGVGSFPKAMENLREKNLISILNDQVLNNKMPILGICLGMQLLATHSDEAGGADGFNWIPAQVKSLVPVHSYKVPHVGWNDLNILRADSLFKKIENGSNFYFDHSFHFSCEEKYVAAKCNYGSEIIAAVQADNIFAAQFHPEKSQTAGLRFLRNFLNKVRLC